MHRRNHETDGGSIGNSMPLVTVIIFDVEDRDLERTLSGALQQFFSSIGEKIPFVPQISVEHRRNPPITHPENIFRSFCQVLEETPGNIRIGVTDAGLWTSSPPPRFIFGQACDYGSALLSTHRFRRETQSRRLLHERLSKEVIKILGLACNLGPCGDPHCILTYHRAVEDLDRNRYVCRHCRDWFIDSLGELLDNSL